MPKPTDIKIKDCHLNFTDHSYRTPIKFGGKKLDRVTILDVTLRLQNQSGNEAVGFGSMTLGNIWSFPTSKHSYDETLGAMKRLAQRIEKGIVDVSGGEALDPFELDALLETQILEEAKTVTREFNLLEPIPKLCSLVTLSPFGAAIHDGFGKAMGRSVYECYGQEYLNRDLAHYLDVDFSGEFPDRYLSAEPQQRMPLYHLVGALDPLTETDIDKRISDGLPETLGDWIVHDGLTHLKIKLNGDNLDWDVDRVLSVNRIADETVSDRDWNFSLDFNERCENVDYLLALLRQVKEKNEWALKRVQYIEQPTARDLAAHPENKMHAAAKIKPVVIDESLIDYEMLLLAEEMGYSGVALKACKGQSQAILMAAAAAKKKMFLCVQDLTCPGASFLHSAGLAAHVPGVVAIEGNARQYCPGANDEWRNLFPSVFTLKDGRIETGVIRGPGLGCKVSDQ